MIFIPTQESGTNLINVLLEIKYLNHIFIPNPSLICFYFCNILYMSVSLNKKMKDDKTIHFSNSCENVVNKQLEKPCNSCDVQYQNMYLLQLFKYKITLCISKDTVNVYLSHVPGLSSLVASLTLFTIICKRDTENLTELK